MTEPDLTAAQQEAVRRMLASARHDDPMPDHVAGRLDEVLAGLSAERPDAVPTDAAPTDSVPTDGPAGAEVVALDSTRAGRARAERSQARRWPAYLLSAAAVVAIGFGVTQMIPSDDPSGGDSAGSAAQDQAPEQAQPSSAPDSDDQADSEHPAQDQGAAPSLSDSLAPQYAGNSLPLPDIAGLTPRRAMAKSDKSTAAKRSRRAPLRLVQRCLPDPVPPSSKARAASFRGKDAVVLYLPPTSTERRVEVWVCGSDSDQPVRSLSLPPEE